ncbi:MAG TPA: hypothetical protein VNO31_34665 [Umezawaea sp.]|nr:hypothetical protein [Umezawaea sp.]
MSARGFATVVGVWPAASKQVVRVTAAPDGGWRVIPVGPVPPVVSVASDLLDVPVPPPPGPVIG